MTLCRQPIKNKLKLFTGPSAALLVSGLFFFLFAIYAFFELKKRPLFVDETFLIRASYIQFHLPQISPQHVTTMTFILGLVLNWVDDVKTLILSSRVFDLGIFLAALWVIPRQLVQNEWARFWFLLLMLIHPTMLFFQSQAKYDAIIFVISLIYVGIIYQKKMLGNLSLFLSAIMLTSTLKGVFYFLPFISVLLWQFFVTGKSLENRKSILIFLAKLMALVGLFIFIFFLFGVSDLFFNTLKQQVWLSQGEQTEPVTSFRVFAIFTDGAFFYGLGAVSIIYFFKHFNVFLRYGSDLLVYLGSVMLFGWIYFLGHPNPYSPMVLAADLALACLVLITFSEFCREIFKGPVVASLLIFTFGLQLTFNPNFFTVLYKTPLRGFTIFESEHILKRANELIPPGSRVFDPIGLIHDALPCSNEWYLDAPYRLKLLKGDWMQNIDWKNCDFALFSIQLTHLDLKTLGEISENFEFTSAYPLMINKRKLQK